MFRIRFYKQFICIIDFLIKLLKESPDLQTGKIPISCFAIFDGHKGD